MVLLIFLSIEFGLNSDVDVETADDQTIKIMVGVELQSVKDGLTLKTSTRIWELDLAKPTKLIVSTTMAIMSHAIVDGLP